MIRVLCCALPMAMGVVMGLGSPARALDYPIRPVPFTDVHVKDVFWLPRMETNRKVTVWYDFKKCEETGRIDNFAKAGRLMPGEFRGTYFDDSDVYKVIEGACYSLAVQYDEKLDKYLDDLIAKIAAAQEPDGYLYTCRTINPEKAPDAAGKTRWSHLVESHELYCVGHMYEAAVAHYQITGKKTLLDVAIKSADLISKTFGPDGIHDIPGHQEIEIGLAKLFRITGNEKYLQTAKFFLDGRGHTKGRRTRREVAQDHKPVVDQDEPVGHAVRAGYMYSGMADVAAIMGYEPYTKALDKIWTNLVSTKMYITGGIGVQGGAEAFGKPYELPNTGAYAETCAAIANALWNQRMFLLHDDAKYVDVLERIIYNGFLSGVSLSGDQFFYVNPLGCDGKSPFKGKDVTRSPWFGCACCPVNVVRFVPSIAGYVYATRDEAIYVNLFIGGTGKAKLKDNTVTLTQETQYPWGEQVRIRIDPEKEGTFTLRVRIPGWATEQPVPSDLYRFATPSDQKVSVNLNGESVPVRTEKGYLTIERPWKKGDTIELTLPMPVRRLVSHPSVKDNHGRVALQRGPIVYCVEGVDHDEKALNLVVPDDSQFAADFKPDLLGGITVLTGPALLVTKGDDGKEVENPTKMTAIPYYAWCHRGATQMAVWIPARAAK